MNRRINALFYRDFGDWPPTDAVECAAWFQRQVEVIPLESRAKARIEIGAQGEDCVYPTIEITWERPETFDEEVSRREDARLQAIRQEQIERHTLAVLREKYP